MQQPLTLLYCIEGSLYLLYRGLALPSHAPHRNKKSLCISIPPDQQVFSAPLSNQAQTAVIFASSSHVPSWFTKMVVDTTPTRPLPSPRLPQGVRCQQPTIRASASAGWEVCLHIELTGEEEKAMVRKAAVTPCTMYDTTVHTM